MTQSWRVHRVYVLGLGNYILVYLIHAKFRPLAENTAPTQAFSGIILFQKVLGVPFPLHRLPWRLICF